MRHTRKGTLPNPFYRRCSGRSSLCHLARAYIEQQSGDEVLLNEGTIYAALVRLQQRGWISAKWGASDNNRRAKYYSLTRSGRKRLTEETSYWQRLTAVIGRVLSTEAGKK